MLTESADAAALSASLRNAERFSVVFDSHFEPIHRFLYRRVGREAADELAAETFAEAFRRRHTYDAARAGVRPWLFGIATNLVRHHVRAERRRFLAYARTGVDPVMHPDMEAVDDRVDAEAMGPRLALALATLRSSERDVLLLYAWADLAYEEIAQALSIPVGTVRSRLHRSRRRIRELIEAGGQSPGVPFDDGAGHG